MVLLAYNVKIKSLKLYTIYALVGHCGQFIFWKLSKKHIQNKENMHIFMKLIQENIAFNPET